MRKLQRKALHQIPTGRGLKKREQKLGMDLTICSVCSPPRSAAAAMPANWVTPALSQAVATKVTIRLSLLAHSGEMRYRRIREIQEGDERFGENSGAWLNGGDVLLAPCGCERSGGCSARGDLPCFWGTSREFTHREQVSHIHTRQNEGRMALNAFRGFQISTIKMPPSFRRHLVKLDERT